MSTRFSRYLSHSFQGSFFPENLQKPGETGKITRQDKWGKKGWNFSSAAKPFARKSIRSTREIAGVGVPSHPGQLRYVDPLVGLVVPGVSFRPFTHEFGHDPLIWLWLKKTVPKWNPGKWKHGPKPV